MSTDLDQQIRSLADLAFAQTDPVATPVRPSRLPRRWLAVAAGLLVVLMTVALITVQRSPDEIGPVDFSTGLSVRNVFAEVPRSELSNSTQARVSGVDFDEVAALIDVERTGLGDAGGAWTSVLVCGTTDCDATPIMAVPLSGELLRQAFRYPEEFLSQLGWTDADIAAVVNWEVAAENGLPTSFDLFRLDADLSALMERAGEDRIVDLGTGNDFEVNFEDTSELRITGVPLHIGVDPSRSVTAVSQSTAAVTSWRESGDSVVDDPVASALASALDETGDIYAFEAMFWDFEVPSRFVDGVPDTLGFTIDDVVISEPFNALGVGWSGIGETQRTSIVYVFESEAAAAGSVEKIADLYLPGADFIDPSSSGEATSMGSIFEVDTVSSSGTSVTVVGRAAAGSGPLEVVAGLQRPSPLALHR